MRNCLLAKAGTIAILLGAAAQELHAQDGSIVAAERPFALPPITVTGSGETATGPVEGFVATQSRTASKTDTAILETPRSISVVSAAEIAARGGAQTIGETLNYTAGVFSVPIASNRVNWTERIRGFSTYQSAFQDGLADPTGMDRAQPQIEPFGAERVEVLKGPASILYGQINPGGIVNVVSKRPTFEPGGLAQIQIGSFDRIQGAADVNGVFGDGSALGWRVVGLAQSAHSQIEFVEDDRFYVAPSLTWKMDDATTLTLLTQYRSAWGQEGAQGFPPELIDRLPRDLNVGEPGFDRDDTTQWALGYEFVRQVTPGISFVQNARYMKLDVDYRQLYSDGLSLDPSDGPGVIDRSVYYLDETLEQFAIDTRVNALLRTGPVGHVLLAGFDYRDQRSENDSDYFYGMGPTLDLLDPVYGQEIGPFDRTGWAKDHIEHTGLYLQDQMALGRWRLTLGGRHDRAKTRFTSIEGDFDTRTDDRELSWNAGLLYLFDSGFAPYASYATSFKPQTGQTWDGRPFDPSKGEQVEVGVKYQPPGMDALVTLSAFDLTQTNVPTEDPDHPFEQIQTGEVRMRGIELEGRAMLGPIQATLAYAYLDSEITRANDGTQGNHFADTPPDVASLWLDYTFETGALRGVTLGGGLRGWTGYWGDNENTQWNRGETLVDLAAGYDFGALRPAWEGITLDLNVSNVADRRITACSAYGCEFGEARMASATLGYRW